MTEEYRIGSAPSPRHRETPAPQPVPTTPRPPRRRMPYLLAAAAGLVAAVVLVGGGWWYMRTAADITVHGTVSVPRDVLEPGCSPERGYGDIVQGAQVTVTDEGGKVLGLGQLGDVAGADGDSCVSEFLVPGVESGHDFYGVEVAHRGVVRYPASRIRQLIQLGIKPAVQP